MDLEEAYKILNVTRETPREEVIEVKSVRDILDPIIFDVEI